MNRTFFDFTCFHVGYGRRVSRDSRALQRTSTQQVYGDEVEALHTARSKKRKNHAHPYEIITVYNASQRFSLMTNLRVSSGALAGGTPLASLDVRVQP